MTKYICDFDSVKKIGNNICNVAKDIKSATDTYSSSIYNDLSSWEGRAKDSFKNTNDKHISEANQNIADVDELGSFVIKAADKIESLETELATMKI